MLASPLKQGQSDRLQKTQKTKMCKDIPAPSAPPERVAYRHITTAELSTLNALNDALRVATAKAKEIGIARSRAMASRRDDAADSMADFSVNGVNLYECWKSCDFDNDFLAEVIHRSDTSLDFRMPCSEQRWLWDMDFYFDRPDALQDINPISLMHDLYKPGKDGKPLVPLEKALRLDHLELMVITTERYIYDIASQKWLQHSDLPPEPDLS